MKLDRKRVLRYYFTKAIIEEISYEIANNTLLLEDIRMLNRTFPNRVLKRFVKSTIPVFTVSELVDFVEEIRKGEGIFD